MDWRVHVQVVKPHPAVAPAVNCQGAAQPFGFLVDRPILLGPQVVGQTHRRQHRSVHTQFFDDAPELFHCCSRLLHGDESHPAEAWTPGQVGMMQPIVVGPGNRYSPVLADDFAIGQRGSGVQHRVVNANVVQEQEPFFGANPASPRGRRLDPVGKMQVIERWEKAHRVEGAGLFVQRGQEFRNAFAILVNMAVSVNYDF